MHMHMPRTFISTPVFSTQIVQPDIIRDSSDMNQPYMNQPNHAYESLSDNPNDQGVCSCCQECCKGVCDCDHDFFLCLCCLWICIDK